MEDMELKRETINASRSIQPDVNVNADMSIRSLDLNLRKAYRMLVQIRRLGNITIKKKRTQADEDGNGGSRICAQLERSLGGLARIDVWRNTRSAKVTDILVLEFDRENEEGNKRGKGLTLFP